MEGLKRYFKDYDWRQKTAEKKAQVTSEGSVMLNAPPRIFDGAATATSFRRQMRQDAALGVDASDGEAVNDGKVGGGRRIDDGSAPSASAAHSASSRGPGAGEMPEGGAAAGQGKDVQMGRDLDAIMRRLDEIKQGFRAVAADVQRRQDMRKTATSAHGAVLPEGVNAGGAGLQAVQASYQGDYDSKEEVLSRSQRKRRRQKAARAVAAEKAASDAMGSAPAGIQMAVEAPLISPSKAARATEDSPASPVVDSPTSVVTRLPSHTARRRLDDGMQAASAVTSLASSQASWVELRLVPLSTSALQTTILIRGEEKGVHEWSKSEAANQICAAARGLLSRRRQRLRSAVMCALGVQAAARRWLARQHVRLRRQGQRSILGRAYAAFTQGVQEATDRGLVGGGTNDPVERWELLAERALESLTQVNQHCDFPEEGRDYLVWCDV